MPRQANAEPAGGGGGAWKDPTLYKRKAEVERKLGHKITLEEFRHEHWVPPPPDGFSKAGKAAAAAELSGEAEEEQSGTSIFDPVLCEIAYRWFSPPDAVVLDPFAGGSVRGIVASRLGRHYVGIDLRPEQVAANNAQLKLCNGGPKPKWVVGDSIDPTSYPKGITADLVFTCPPFWNLEVYSEDPRDLSTMESGDFLSAQAAIIAEACSRLKKDRFAVWVTSDVRDEDGFYIGLPGRTVSAFEAAGLRLYNECISVTAAGSLPIRVRKQFEASRKVGRTHQVVQVFCKGDPVKATKQCGETEFGEIDTQGEMAAALATLIGGEV